MQGSMIGHFIYVAVGGALGCCCRYAIGLAGDFIFQQYPKTIGILLANMLGCLLIGLVSGLFAKQILLHPQLRLFVVTGFLGGLTTFSSWQYNLGSALQNNHFGLFFADLILQVTAGLSLFFIGFWLVNKLLGTS